MLVRDVMTKNVKWCFEDADVDEAALLMEDHKIHHLPVLNKDQRLVGLLDADKEISAKLAPSEMVEILQEYYAAC